VSAGAAPVIATGGREQRLEGEPADVHRAELVGLLKPDVRTIPFLIPREYELSAFRLRPPFRKNYCLMFW
jgi:hypothetical protein